MDFLDLPLPFHRRLLEFLCAGDVPTLIRYSRTCRYLMELAKKSPANEGCDVVLDTHGLLWINGRGLNRKRQGSEQPQGIYVADCPELPVDTGLWLEGPLACPDRPLSWSDNMLHIVCVKTIRPDWAKVISRARYAWISCDDTESVKAVTCPAMRICFEGPDRNIEPLIDTFIAEWKAGLREIRDICLLTAPPVPAVNAPGIGKRIEFVRGDGRRLTMRTGVNYEVNLSQDA